MGLTGISTAERFGDLLKTGLYADCVLSTSGCEIPAHRYVLAGASPEFEKIFFQSSKTKCLDNLERQKVDFNYSIEVLKILLDFAYLQEINFNKKDLIILEQVIKAATEYKMKDLIELCGIFLMENFDYPTVMNILFANKMDDFKKYITYSDCFVKYRNEVKTYESFSGSVMRLSEEALKFCLENDAIGSNDENLIIWAVIQWAETQMRSKRTVHLRDFLDEKDLFKYLKFLRLLEAEFQKITFCYPGLLSEDEKKYIGRYIKKNSGVSDTEKTNIITPDKISLDDDLRSLNRQDSIKVEKVDVYTNWKLISIDAPYEKIKAIKIAARNRPNVSFHTHYVEDVVIFLKKNSMVAATEVQRRVRYGTIFSVPVELAIGSEELTRGSNQASIYFMCKDAIEKYEYTIAAIIYDEHE